MHNFEEYHQGKLKQEDYDLSKKVQIHSSYKPILPICILTNFMKLEMIAEQSTGSKEVIDYQLLAQVIIQKIRTTRQKTKNQVQRDQRHDNNPQHTRRNSCIKKEEEITQHKNNINKKAKK